MSWWEKYCWDYEDKSGICAFGGAVGEVLVIDAPFAPDQVETSEAHDDGFLEAGEEHVHNDQDVDLAVLHPL